MQRRSAPLPIVAFVGGNQEVMLPCQTQGVLQVGGIHYRTHRVGGAAQEKQLAALPCVGRHCVKIRQKAAVSRGVQIMWFSACEQCRAFVDLIARVWHQHQRRLCAGARIHHCLHESKQGFARAIHRQHLRVGVDAACRQRETPFGPACRGGAQFRKSTCGRIAAKLGQMCTQGVEHEVWRRMPGLADRQRYMRQVRRRHQTLLQFRKAFEGVGGQPLEARVHCQLVRVSAAVSLPLSCSAVMLSSGRCEVSVM
jgi:hypothetical protein